MAERTLKKSAKLTDTRLVIRMSHKDRELLSQQSEDAGLTMSSYIRMLIHRKKGK